MNNTTTTLPQYIDTEDEFLEYKEYNIGLLLLSLFGVVLSVIALFIIIRSRKLRKRTSNKFLVNLFFTDFCVSLLITAYSIFPLSVENSSESIKGAEGSPIFHIFISMFMSLSLVNRITVSLDRLIAVKKPFYYEERFTTKFAAFLIIVQFSVALIYFTILMVGYATMENDIVTDIIQVSFIVLISCGFVALTSSNIMIYYEARKQIIMISKFTVSNGPDDAIKIRNSVRQKECKIVRVYIGMVACFVICWIPLLITMFYEYSWKRASNDVVYVVMYCLCLNYILDPIIYVGLSKDVKNELKKLLFKRKQDSSVKISTTSTTVIENNRK